MRLYPAKAAEYLHDIHWVPAPPSHVIAEPLIVAPGAVAFNTTAFTMEELNAAIESMKRNKATGPDQVRAEDWQYLNDANRLRLLSLYSDIKDTGRIPDTFNECHIVQIIKPGKDSRLHSSYRPISLLNTAYKLLAKLLHTRLQVLDNHIVCSNLATELAKARPTRCI